MTEKQIVERCKAGDRKAFTLLYNRHAPKMMGVCYRYAKSKEEAEDMLQEGFIRLFRNINSYKGTGSFEGWTRKIIVNTAINYYKTQIKYNTTINMDDNVIEINCDDHTDIEEVENISQNSLLEMIKQLPEGYRMVFNLYVMDGYTHQEIADALNISVNTSKSQLSKARKLLRDKVNRYKKQYNYA